MGRIYYLLKKFLLKGVAEGCGSRLPEPRAIIREPGWKEKGGPIFSPSSREGHSITHPVLLDQMPNFPGFICRVMISRQGKEVQYPQPGGGGLFNVIMEREGISSRVGGRV